MRIFLFIKNIAKRILPLPIVHAVQQNEVLLARLSRIEDKLKTTSAAAKSKKKIIFGTGDMAKRAFNHYARDNMMDVFCFADLGEGGTEFCGKPVISFDEFTQIHKKYDVIIAVFDVREILPALDDALISKFTVWQEHLTMSACEFESVTFDRLSLLEKNDERKKIIYGFDGLQDVAFRYYGSDNVYAFADDTASGTAYMNKDVLHTRQLAALQKEYDIVVCSKNCDKTFNYFSQNKITQYRKSILVSYYFERKNDVRFAGNATLYNPINYLELEESTRSPKVNEELKSLDFIENPGLLNSYADHLIRTTRRVGGLTRQNSAFTATRNIGENFAYGNFEAFSDYAGVKAEHWAFPAITHGYAVLDAYGYPVRLNWRSVLGAGPKIKAIYHEISRDCMYFAVGPFFHYIKSFYDDEKLAQLKEAQGKNLTVFPVHTVVSHSQTYDIDAFIKRVFEEAKQFDSLTVCTYFFDYNTEVIQRLKAGGAKIVTAGFNFDTSFMSRLKTIFLLADAVLTNTLGSHVNHALSLNKPVKLIRQEVVSSCRHHNNDATKIAMKNAQSHLQSVLETSDYRITKKQIEAFDPITGFNLVKSKEEITALFDLSGRIIMNADFKHDKFVASMRDTYIELSKATSEAEQLQYRLMKDALPNNYS